MKKKSKLSLQAKKAVAIRLALKSAFPGMWFSVKTHKGRTYSEINIAAYPYKDVTREQIEAIVMVYHRDEYPTLGGTGVNLHWQTQSDLQKKLDKALKEEDYTEAAKIHKKITKIIQK